MIRKYRTFKSNGINDLLSDSEKEYIQELKKKIDLLEQEKQNLHLPKIKNIYGNTSKSGAFSRQVFIIDYDYDVNHMAKIFDLKNRTNNKYKITFKNKKGYSSEVESVYYNEDGTPFLYNGYPVLKVRFGKFATKMTLNKFLHLVSTKEFTDIKPKEFVQAYLRDYKYSNKYQEDVARINSQLERVLKELEEVSSKYNVFQEKYKEQELTCNRDFEKIQEEYLKLEKEAKVKKQNKELKQNLLKVRALWNTLITESDKAKFLGWLCKNIYSMRCYVLQGGASEQSMDRVDAYPDDIYGKKKRTIPQYTEDGKLISNDSVNGYIRVITNNNAPLDSILPLCQKKNVEDIFNGNRLNDLNLMLFLLNEYNDYGFKVGQIHLNDYIDYERLRDEKFPNHIAEFNAAYNN